MGVKKIHTGCKPALAKLSLRTKTLQRMQKSMLLDTIIELPDIQNHGAL